jgi:hypothetical protein
MLKLILYLLLITILTSCSNAKIEYKDIGCISPPGQQIDSAVANWQLEDYRERQIAQGKKDSENLRIYDSIKSFSKTVYLINKSYTKTIQFTVKVDAANSNSKTKIYKLNPGEEQIIGCTWAENEQQDYQNYTYIIVGEKEVSK